MIVLLSLIVACALGATQVEVQDIPIQIDRFGDRVIALYPGSQGNASKTIAIAAEKGIVIVDTGISPTLAVRIRKLIEEEFGRDDIAYVINTHSHFDHTNGNQAYAGTTVIGHERCPAAMSQFAAGIEAWVERRRSGRIANLKSQLEGLDPESAEARGVREAIAIDELTCEDMVDDFVSTPPAKTFDDRMSLEMGNLTLELIYYGGAHTDDNIVVYIPQEKILLLGDQFMEGSLMMYLPGAPLEVERTIEVLDSLLAEGAGVEQIICGHRTMTSAELAVRRDYISELLTGVKDAMAEGLTLDEAVAKLSLENGFESVKSLNLDESAPMYHAANVQAVWMSLTESAAMALGGKIDELGLEAALAAFEAIKADTRTYYTSEREFNALGYRLLQERKVEEAIAVLKLNTELYPASWNVWDSLGEAYMFAGQRDLALSNYKKSLELNPNNNNAVLAISRIDGMVYNEQHETTEPLKVQPGSNTGLQGPYLGQKPPREKPELFAPGIVSTAGVMEFCVAVSPDGKEIYFSRLPKIYVTRLTDDGWTAPEPAPFTGPVFEHEPHITVDGGKLFFGSRRPTEEGQEPDYNIWVTERTADGWGEPYLHGPGMYVSTAANGNLYITDVTRVAGGGIIYYPMENGVYGDPINLGGGVNSPAGGVHPCIAPDESFIIFDSSRIGGQGGEGDLYVCFRNDDGSWGEAINLGDEINNPGTNFCATLSPDGKYLFYCSARDVYWVSTEILKKLKP